MSTALVCSNRPLVQLKFLHATARTYASPSDQAGDPKQQIIRRVLYPSNLRSQSTPTGTWRPDVGRALQRAIPSKQAHETIERAWLLHQRQLRQKREAEMERKFECMKNAMDVLRQVDLRLYMEANKKDDPRVRSPDEVQMLKTMRASEIRAMESRIRGLFPRELRIPVDTPSRTGWKYEWKAFKRPI
jgi:large subunit ribosomal protein L40